VTDKKVWLITVQAVDCGRPFRKSYRIVATLYV